VLNIDVFPGPRGPSWAFVEGVLGSLAGPAERRDKSPTAPP